MAITFNLDLYPGLTFSLRYILPTFIKRFPVCKSMHFSCLEITEIHPGCWHLQLTLRSLLFGGSAKQDLGEYWEISFFHCGILKAAVRVESCNSIAGIYHCRNSRWQNKNTGCSINCEFQIIHTFQDFFFLSCPSFPPNPWQIFFSMSQTVHATDLNNYLVLIWVNWELD